MSNTSKYILLTFGLLFLMASTSLANKLISTLKLLEENNIPKLKAYKDSGGVWTIGFGSIYNYDLNRRVQQNDVISIEQAERYLKKEATEKLNLVKQLVKVPATNNMLLAMASLAYNIGGTAFANSTLLKQLNAGIDKNIVAKQFDRWIYDNGIIVQGLVNRRKKEKEIFLG